MTVTEKKVVELEYELRLDSESGELVEKVEKDKPLQYISGIGVMLPKFEENINGLKVGDNFKFKLECEDGYGRNQENMVVDLHKDVFKVDGKFDENLLVVDNVIPMMDQDGNHLHGKVLKLEGDNVTLDFNHPLVDKDLFFTGSVVSVREATEEELAHGHAHCDDHGCACDSGCGCH